MVHSDRRILSSKANLLEDSERSPCALHTSHDLIDLGVIRCIVHSIVSSSLELLGFDAAVSTPAQDDVDSRAWWAAT